MGNSEHKGRYRVLCYAKVQNFSLGQSFNIQSTIKQTQWYLVWVLLAFITAPILLGLLSTTFLQISLGVLSHSTSTCPKSSSTPAGGAHRHWAATWSVATHIQMFWGWVTASHFKTGTLIYWNHFEAFWKVCLGSLSCWKVNQGMCWAHKLHNSQESNLKNAGVQLSTHSSIYCAYMIHSLGSCVAPNHQESAPKPDNPLVWLCFKPDPGFFHTQALPFDPVLLTLVSCDQFTLPQSSRVQCWCSRAPLPMSPRKKWSFLLYGSLETCLSQGINNSLEGNIKVWNSFELWASIRGDSLGKGELIIGYELPWMPTRALGQAVFDIGVKSLNCRVADMHLGSHLVSGFAILE